MKPAKESDDTASKADKTTDALNERTQSLWKPVLKTMVSIILTVFLTFIGIRVGLLPDPEPKALDLQTLFNAPLKDSPVATVVITDNDYKKYFKKKSPLNREVIYQIVDAIAKQQPAVIGVDLDTSDSSFKDFPMSDDWPPVVWARGTYSDDDKGKRKLMDVLGGQSPPPCSAIISLTLDHDDVLRHYRRFMGAKQLNEHRRCATKEETQEELTESKKLCRRIECPFPSFALALLDFYEDEKRFTRSQFRDLISSRHREEELAIRFTKGYQRNSEQFAGNRLDMTAEAVINAVELMAAQSDFPRPLKGKIVLLGGSYAAGRDEYQTPFGMMQGIHINAQIVETEYQGGGFPPPNMVAFIVALIFENILLVIVLEGFDKRLGIPFSILLVFVLALFCSYQAFHTTALFYYFIPIFSIGWLIAIYDKARELQKESILHLFRPLLPGKKTLSKTSAGVRENNDGNRSQASKPESINNAHHILTFANDFCDLVEQWQLRINFDLRNRKRGFPAKLCCFKRADGSDWYGGCELQGGGCLYIGEGCLKGIERNK